MTLGEACEENKHACLAHVNNSECRQGHCQCLTGYREVGVDQCIQREPLTLSVGCLFYLSPVFLKVS